MVSYSSVTCYPSVVAAGSASLKSRRARGLFNARSPIQWLVNWLLPSLLLSALSARAEAPPSQEFWNYLVEFGDAQGELFDPTDYATIVNLPAQLPQQGDRDERVPAVPTESEQAHKPALPAAPVSEEHLP